MIESDLGDLECIHCHNELSFHKIIHKEEKVIRTAVVSCSGCSRKFAILEYVLIMLSSIDAKQLLPDYLLDEYVVLISNCDDDSSYVTNKAMRCGANWKKQFAEDFIVTKYTLDNDGFWGAQAFWNFCGLEPSQINNQDVMVYCGGTGRETYHLLAAEPNRVFVLDLGSHIFNIPSLCQPHISKLVLILSDFYSNPIKPNIATISICDHALQHIEDNKSAFRYIVDNTKEGGMISICVYSHENNIIMTHMIEPSKRVLHKLNLEWLKRLGFFPAVFLYAINILYRILLILSGRKELPLPFFSLLNLWGKDGFSKFHKACYDLIQAPVSYHFKRDEIEEMAMKSHLNTQKLDMMNQTMWTLVASIPKSSELNG